MSVVIVDYGSGNLRSAAKALERAAAESAAGARVVVSARAADLADASHIVLPGVGAFGDCKRGLAALAGMWQALDGAVNRAGKPFLGICVGMQLMARVGHEHGDHAGFGWIDGEVAALDPAAGGRSKLPTLKVPHMGWNDLEVIRPEHPVLRGIASGAHAYFLHSYHMECVNPQDVCARVSYGAPVTAIVARDNMLGTQFHPEKSQAIGLRLLANFLAWRP